MLKNFIRQLLELFYPLVKKLLPFSVYAYLAVGAANTLLNIGLFTVAFYLLQPGRAAVEIATVLSFGITVLTGFWLGRHIAFAGVAGSNKAVPAQFTKYCLVSLQGQLLDYVLTKAIIVLLHMNPVTAYLISTFIMLTLTYFLQKYFTFRSESLKIKYQSK